MTKMIMGSLFKLITIGFCYWESINNKFLPYGKSMWPLCHNYASEYFLNELYNNQRRCQKTNEIAARDSIISARWHLQNWETIYKPGEWERERAVKTRSLRAKLGELTCLHYGALWYDKQLPHLYQIMAHMTLTHIPEHGCVFTTLRALVVSLGRLQPTSHFSNISRIHNG